jgi:hypothetical protein
MNDLVPFTLSATMLTIAVGVSPTLVGQDSVRLSEVIVNEGMTTHEALRVLRESRDPSELESAALSLLQSDDKGALTALTKFLKDEDFVRRIDDDEAYRHQHYTKLRLFRILGAIGALSTEDADAVLLELSQDALYARKPGAATSRYAALLVAAGGLRKPSDALLDFLEEQAARGRAYSPNAIVSLGRMASDRAQDIVVSHVLSTGRFPDLFLTLRNDPNVVALYGRLIVHAETIKNVERRNFIAQSLLRPQFLWGEPDAVMSSPPREEASTEVLREVLKIADIVLKQEDLYEPQTLEDARKGREEIEKILAEREKTEKDGTERK